MHEDPENANPASENAELIAMLRQSADSYLASSPALARARAWRAGQHDALSAQWAGFAALGWCGMLASEEAGGTGFGLPEACALHEVLASQLVPEPLLMGAHLPIIALSQADTDAAAALATEIAEGQFPATLVWQTRPGMLSADDTAIRLEGGKLTGEAQVVVLTSPEAPMIVAAREAAGVALYRVAPHAPGVSLSSARLADGTPLAHIVLNGVAPQALLVPAPLGGAALDSALDAGRILISAELLGAMRAVFAMTLDYLKTRKQFGKAIGSFQALQHRAVDLHAEIELTSAALEAALSGWASADAITRAVLASGVKARASDGALRVAREAIQLHGAIAYTDEHDAGLYLARAMTQAALLGNGAAHRKRYLALVQAV